MVKGSVDGLDRHVVSGWAYDSSRPERPLDVSVFLGDRLLFQTEASAWRDDLAEAGIGDGCHAFFHVLPQPIEEDKLSDISVVAEGQRLALSRSSLRSPSDAYVVGSIERLDRYGVAGWAYNTAAPSHSVSVSILLEDRLLDRLDADLFRSDLEVANIGTGRHAFRYAFVDEVPEHELSKVSVRVGAVCLPRASLIEPFHASLVGNDPASGIDRIRSRARVFPVSLRRTFDIASDSVIGRLMRLLHKEFPPSVERITSMLNDLCDVAKSDNAERLHLEKMSVNFGDRVEQVEVSRTNTHFISVDRGVREYMLGYEPEILASIDLFVPDEGVLLDIGSNWGCFSIFLAARPRFSGRAYAFEPSSRSFQDLVKLVEDLKLKERIVCHKLALADYTGSARLSIGLFSGLSSISDSVAENYAVAYENVQVSRLDDLALPSADLIKIDVEGVEANVLRGGTGYIRGSRPAIILENWIFPGDLKKTSEPLEILEAWDYKFFLPSWTNSERSLFSPIPIGESISQLFALCPFELGDRILLDERVNILALPRGRLTKIETSRSLQGRASRAAAF